MDRPPEPVRRGSAGLLAHQLEFVSDRESRIKVLQGGYRSGKSVAGLAAVVDFGLRSAGAPILVVGPTYRLIFDVFVRTAKEFLTKWRIPWTYHKTDKILRVGRRLQFDILCRSADEPRALEGLTVGGLLVDEWELCDVEALGVAMARVSVGPCQQTALTGTPEGYGPAYELVLAKHVPGDGTRLMVVDTSMNTTLRASYKADMAKRLDEDTAVEKLGGVRRAKGGTIYSRFRRELHTTARCVQRGQLQVWADFNVQTMHWVAVEVDPNRRCAHVVGEVIGTNTDTAAQAEAMKRWLLAYVRRTRRADMTMQELMALEVPVYCDATATQRSSTTPLTNAALIKQAGFVAKHGLKNPIVDDRINSVQVALRDMRLTFDATAAPRATMAIERQGWKGGQPDKTSGLDHAADAIGYGVHWQWPAWQTGTPEGRG